MEHSGRINSIEIRTTFTTDDFSASSFRTGEESSGQRRRPKKSKEKRQRTGVLMTEKEPPKTVSFEEKENIDDNPCSNRTDLPPKREKIRRRRQIDPTTCERDYSLDEIEFMNALDDYKRTSGRMFPTCSEILEVIRSLGYVRMPRNQDGDQETAFASMTATPLHAGTPALLNETCGESEEIVTVLWSGKERIMEETPLPSDEEFPDFDYREPLLIF